MVRRALLLVTTLGIAGLVACTGGPSPEEEPSSSQTARFGLISVTYGHDWVETGDRMLLSSAAQFVRYSGLNRDHVARLLALPLDPERDLPGMDRCKVYDLSVDLAGSAASDPEELGAVELLEAGELKVETLGRHVTLAPKHFPGLLPFISGVVYSEAEGTLVERAERVRAYASGGEAVGTFSVAEGSPELPRLLGVGGADPGAELRLVRDRALELRWQAARSAAVGDVMYLELRYSRAQRDMALRCQPRDDGAFEIPAALLVDVSGKSTLELARVRRTSFAAAGLDQGELRVTVRDTAVLE